MLVSSCVLLLRLEEPLPVRYEYAAQCVCEAALLQVVNIREGDGVIVSRGE